MTTTWCDNDCGWEDCVVGGHTTCDLGGEGWVLKGLSRRSSKGWVEFSLGKGPGGWPGHTAEGTMCSRGWRNRVHMTESPGCLGRGEGVPGGTLWNSLVPSPWGIRQDLSVLACWFAWLVLNSLDPSLLLGVWCLLSWLSLCYYQIAISTWPGCLCFCSTPTGLVNGGLFILYSCSEVVGTHYLRPAKPREGTG